MAKILVVEDEKYLNEAYELILKKAGHNVVAVFNGEEALEAIKKQKPQLILLDLRMPKMDGVKFLKKLDPTKNLPRAKIIIFSNYENNSEIEEAFRQGASRYILKAWSSPSELTKVISDALAK